MKADLLLDSESTDIDGVVEVRSNTVSVFNGPLPLILTFEHEGDLTFHDNDHHLFLPSLSFCSFFNLIHSS